MLNTYQKGFHIVGIHIIDQVQVQVKHASKFASFGIHLIHNVTSELFSFSLLYSWYLQILITRHHCIGYWSYLFYSALCYVPIAKRWVHSPFFTCYMFYKLYGVRNQHRGTHSYLYHDAYPRCLYAYPRTMMLVPLHVAWYYIIA